MQTKLQKSKQIFLCLQCLANQGSNINKKRQSQSIKKAIITIIIMADKNKGQEVAKRRKRRLSQKRTLCRVSSRG